MSEGTHRPHLLDEESARAIIELSPDAIWVFDLEGRTLHVNQAMADLYGGTRDDLTAITVFDTLDEVGREQFAAHLAALRAGARHSEDVECLLRRRDGTALWVLASETLLRHPDGTLRSIVHRFRDYSARREVLDRLRESETRLEEAQRSARIGSWVWEAEDGHLGASDGLREVYGLESAEFATPMQHFLSSVHLDDRPAVEAALGSVSGPGPQVADSFEFDARVRGAQGWVWTRCRGVAHRDVDGTLVSMSGTHQDITASKRVELALIGTLAQNSLLRAVADAANQAATLEEVLTAARSLVLGDDNLQRGRAYRPPAAGTDGALRPIHLDAADRLADLEAADQVELEQSLARRAWVERRPCWDAERRTIAFPVTFDDQVPAVLTVTTGPRLSRREVVEPIVAAVAVQLARVAERERAADELARARDDAMAASRQKSEFMATMSHEIRTPLNGVIGLTDLLLRTPLDPEQLRLVSGMQVAGQALMGVINDVLDFSKMDAGRLSLESVAFSPRAVLEQVASVHGASARGRGLAFVSSCAEDVPDRLLGDPTRLRQVVGNLVSNAVKFTDRGSVEVLMDRQEPSADPDATVLRIAVRDTGLGIEESELGRLFEPFTQADASTTRTHGGTGLGLAIAREIAEALGGELRVSSTPGQGTEFALVAPFRPAPPVDDEADAAPAPPASTARLARAGVLLVEDNPVNQIVATGLLESMGCRVTVAGDGREALVMVERAAYDVVLMDVQMPHLDGYAATRAIRSGSTVNRTVPIIAMTAAAIEGERDRCLSAGMDDFLTKPIDAATLAAVLGDWLGHGTLGPARAAAGPETPPPGAEGLVLERLAELRDLDPGNTDYLDRAIDNFTANSVACVGDLAAAIAEGDADRVRQVAHKMVGGALNLGAADAGEALRRLEHLADAGRLDGAEALLVEADVALAAARTALAAYRASYSSSSR